MELNELKDRCLAYVRAIEEFDIKIAETLEKEPERNTLFFYFENSEDEDEDWLEYWKENDVEWQKCDEEELRKEYEAYKIMSELLINRRTELFEKKYKVFVEFEEWKEKNGVTYKVEREYMKEYEVFKPEWRGWDFSNIIYETMIKSIGLTDEDEINELIINMVKVLEMVDGCLYDDWIYFLEILNNQTRYRENEGCMTTLALDIMENHGIYEPFKESFKACVYRISKMVDNEFLFYVQYKEDF